LRNTNKLQLPAENIVQHYSVETIESITGCTHLESIEKGDSVQKYRAKLENRPVVIRIFPEELYYGNRFEREGYALETLRDNDKIEYDHFVYPRIIEDFPKQRIRVVEWIEGRHIDPNQMHHKIFAVLTELSSIQADTHLSLLPDLQNHLVDTTKMEPGMGKMFVDFTSSLNEYIQTLPDSPNSLLHGDYHPENILLADNQKLGIIDWEFASYGHFSYDLTYYYLNSGLEIPTHLKQLTQRWIPICTAVICHWFLSHLPDHQESKYWLKKLDNLIKKDGL
jgi:aminoglycoside phosphotransferase (APT) family kinase protein